MVRRLSHLTLSASVWLCAARAFADPPTAQAEVEVSTLFEEHARLLDAHRWDPRAPEVLAGENDLTVRAVELAVTAGTPLADGLLEALGGDALGAHLRTLPTPPAALVAAFLRRHRDPALLAYARATVPYGSLALCLARARTPDAAPLLLRAITDSGRYDRERYCTEAMHLPPAALTELSAQAVSALTPLSADLTGPQCAALLAASPAGLSALARSAPSGASAPAPQFVSVGVNTALLLEAHGHHREALTRLNAALPASTSQVINWQIEVASDLALLAPSLDAGSAGLLHAVRRVTESLGFYRWRAVPLRLRARDPELLSDAGAALHAGRVDHEGAETYAMAAAWMAPAGATAPTRELLGGLQHIPNVEILPAQIDLWRDALDATDRCRDDACLARLLVDSTDETAARAAFLLGDRGLSRLDPAVASAVARRVVIRSAPWLAAALSVTLRTCPAAMRAVARTDPRALPDVRALRFDGYLRALSARCAQ